jgi:hypothetical protein
MRSSKWNKPIRGEWASALESYISMQAEVVPPGWKRVTETLQAMGLKSIGSGSRSKMLLEMIQKGILERKQFRVADSSGRRIMPIDHYRLVSKGK